MNRVYVVTRGWYSDYHIEAIFATKKDAEAHALRDADFNEPDEWRVIEADDPQPQKVVVYGASAEWFWDRDGTVRTWSFESWDYDLGEHGLNGRKKVHVREGNAPAGHYIRAWSLDLDRAKKACAERRDLYLAKLAGIA